MPEQRTYFYLSWYRMIQMLPKKDRLEIFSGIFDAAFCLNKCSSKSELSENQKRILEIALHQIEISRTRSACAKSKGSFAEANAQAKPQQMLKQNDTENDEFCLSKCSSREEKEKGEKNGFSPSYSLFPEEESQDNKEEQGNAHAGTGARALKPWEKPDFQQMMPEHLRDDEDFRAEWDEWLAYRRRTHRSVSQYAASRQLNLLGGYSATDAIRIIENSISNDWQGLFPERTKNVKPKRDYTGL